MFVIRYFKWMYGIWIANSALLTSLCYICLYDHVHRAVSTSCAHLLTGLRYHFRLHFDTNQLEKFAANLFVVFEVAKNEMAYYALSLSFDNTVSSTVSLTVVTTTIRIVVVFSLGWCFFFSKWQPCLCSGLRAFDVDFIEYAYISISFRWNLLPDFCTRLLFLIAEKKLCERNKK